MTTLVYAASATIVLSAATTADCVLVEKDVNAAIPTQSENGIKFAERNHLQVWLDLAAAGTFVKASLLRPCENPFHFL